MTFILHSDCFADGGDLPRRLTCDGANLSPSLRWSGAPTRAARFAVLCDDPDAPHGTFHHWAAWDIPADRTSLSAGYGIEAADPGVRQARNDFSRKGYAGPCPPRGGGAHRYLFRLLALSAPIEAPPDPNCLDIHRLARPLTLAAAELTGRYGR
jgi:Raf kinase inhibitor-like YbhB/YbcL family protein